MTFMFSLPLDNEISHSHKAHNFFKILTILFIFIALLYSNDSYAQQHGSMSYCKINKMLAIIDEHAKSPYTGLIATIKPEHSDIQLSDIELAITHNNRPIQTLLINDNGTVNFPLLASDIGRNARLAINQPKGSFALDLTAGVKPITKHKVRYKDVMGVLNDLELVASELVGIPTWLIPDIDHIEFEFKTPATITLQDIVFKTTDELTIQIERNSNIQASDAELFFSVQPTRVNIVK